MGSPCEGDMDCMGAYAKSQSWNGPGLGLSLLSLSLTAYFFCGTDGMCGGSGAKCISGNEGCLSGRCTEEVGSEQEGICLSPPAEGVPEDFGCSVDSNCETRHCDRETFVCTQRRALAASQAARVRTKRDGSSHYNPKERRGKVSSWFRSHAYCATGQTACSTVGGFEVGSAVGIFWRRAKLTGFAAVYRYELCPRILWWMSSKLR